MKQKNKTIYGIFTSDFSVNTWLYRAFYDPDLDSFEEHDTKCHVSTNDPINW